MTHHIKIQQAFADAVLTGDKNFEIRYNDRGYQKGDIVVFSVVSKASAMEQQSYLAHPLAREIFEITYVLQGWGLKDDYCVFGIRKIGKEEKNATEEI